MIRDLITVVAAVAFALGAVNATEKQLNLILIMADDLGYETITCNGGESYKTPNLDKMAEVGMRFEHCYSQSICTPSRVQIMTGKYNDRNYTKFGELKRGELTFAQLLKNQGYKTCIAGKWQLGKEPDAPQHFGFDQSLLWQHTRPRTREGESFDSRFSNPRFERNGVEEDSNKGEFGPDLCADFICEFIEANKDKPFLAYYPMILTHCPFIPVPETSDWNPDSPGSPSYKGDAKYFGDMVTYMDKLVGRIVEQVEKSGISDRTVIIFTGDNGTDSPVVTDWKGIKYAGGKGKTTNAGNHVPLIVHAPGLKGRGVKHDLIDFTDMLPTLCDLAGLDPYKVGHGQSWDGRSFAPQLKGEKNNPRDYVFSWYSPQGKAKAAKVWAHDGHHKLYRDGRFFDLLNDRLEEKPLKGELTDEQKTVKAKLQAILDKRLKEVGR